MAICMVFCQFLSVYLSTGLVGAGNGTTAGVGARDTVEVCKKVPLLSVEADFGASLAISSSPVGRKFCWRLRQVHSNNFWSFDGVCGLFNSCFQFSSIVYLAAAWFNSWCWKLLCIFGRTCNCLVIFCV